MNLLICSTSLGLFSILIAFGVGLFSPFVPLLTDGLDALISKDEGDLLND